MKQIFNNEILGSLKKDSFIDKKLFLRELILNANKSVIKLEELKKEKIFIDELKDYKGRIEVYFEPSDKSITIVDNGIGFSKDELIEFTKISDILTVLLVSKNISIISKKIGEDTAYKCKIQNDEISINSCINEEYSGTVIYIKLEQEFAESFTNIDKLKSYINEFINQIKIDLFVSYYEDFEEKIEKLN